MFCLLLDSDVVWEGLGMYFYNNNVYKFVLVFGYVVLGDVYCEMF